MDRGIGLSLVDQPDLQGGQEPSTCLHISADVHLVQPSECDDVDLVQVRCFNLMKMGHSSQVS